MMIFVGSNYKNIKYKTQKYDAFINNIVVYVYGLLYNFIRTLIFYADLKMQKKPVEKLERLLLDKAIDKIRPLANFNRPNKGWIKTIREGLGMTVAQLAKRMALNQSRISIIEREEVFNSITLKTLDNVAKALNCKVVYALIPEKSLQITIEEQAKKAVLKQNENLIHSMSLEGQEVDDERLNDLVTVQAEDMLQKKISKIWEGD